MEVDEKVNCLGLTVKFVWDKFFTKLGLLFAEVLRRTKGDAARNDSQRRLLAQHSVAMLERCCNHSKLCRNNVETLCCAKNRRCESSRITSS